MQKVAIITGASHGIGLAIANRLADSGWKVYGISRKEFLNDKFKSYQSDINDHQKIEKIFREIFEKEGHIDALINNAGFGIAGAIEETEFQNIEKIVSTNLSAQIKSCKMIIPYLRQSKGKIINISSVAGMIPLPFQACYSATKAGVEVFSRALAMEVEPFGIKVTAILPGDTKTNFTNARVVDKTEHSAYEERVDKSIGRMAKDEQNGKSPEVLAKVVEKVLNKKNPPLRKTIGGLSKFEIFLTRICSTKLVNFIVKKLYG